MSKKGKLPTADVLFGDMKSNSSDTANKTKAMPKGKKTVKQRSATPLQRYNVTTSDNSERVTLYMSAELFEAVEKAKLDLRRRGVRINKSHLVCAVLALNIEKVEELAKSLETG